MGQSDMNREQSQTDEAMDAIRHRPTMYFGPLGATAIEQLIVEIVLDAIDEFLNGTATDIKIKIDEDCIEVSDNGIGLPFDLIERNGNKSLATCHLTRLQSSRSAIDDRTQSNEQGTINMGLGPVNAVSIFLKCQSWRNGKLWQQEFSKGRPVGPAKIIQEGTGRGTSITLKPDADVLQARRPRLAAVRARLFEAAHLFPGLKISFQEEKFHAPNGIDDLLFIQYPASLFKMYRWANRPIFHFETKTEEATIHAVAFGETKASCVWHTWVNGYPTVQHGSHQLGFSDALRRMEWEPIVALLHVTLKFPEYFDSTRDQLNLPALRNTLSMALTPELRSYCEQNEMGKYRTNDLEANRTPQASGGVMQQIKEVN